MYTGITTGLFQVTHVDKHPGLTNYTVRLNVELLTNLRIGASIAIDGVCQTVVAIDAEAQQVSLQAIQATLERTTLMQLYHGRLVSVERSLCYGAEIGGHELAGHIMGTATIIQLIHAENNLAMTLSCPHAWMKFILPQGYIAVDGSSLTINRIDLLTDSFTVHLIPETLRRTNFGNKVLGDLVNVELDQKTLAIITTVESILAQKQEVIACTRFI